MWGVCLSACLPAMPYAQKRSLDSLALETKVFVRYYVDAGNQTWISI